MDAHRALNLHLGEAVVTQRHVEVGSVARLALERDPDDYQWLLQHFVWSAAVVTQELYSHTREHTLVYCEVQVKRDGTYDFKRAVKNFGTSISFSSEPTALKWRECFSSCPQRTMRLL